MIETHSILAQADSAIGWKDIATVLLILLQIIVCGVCSLAIKILFDIKRDLNALRTEMTVAEWRIDAIEQHCGFPPKTVFYPKQRPNTA